MAHATPGSEYTVQPNDTLSSIAQQAYGNPNYWSIIYNANIQIIGPNHSLIRPGEELYIPTSGQQIKLCKVTAANGIYIRTQATSNSTIVTSYPHGTSLNYVNVVNGENVNGNPHWGHSAQGHYYWLGATDHPNG